jgi:diguanylate cyclase (GGDEF)-like protein/PAS domain S-box-containing protein
MGEIPVSTAVGVPEEDLAQGASPAHAAPAAGGHDALRWMLAGSLTVGIFVLDASSSPDLAVALAYLPLVILAMWFGGEWAPVQLASVCAVLVFAGWGLDRQAGSSALPLLNRLLTLGAIGISGALCTWRKRTAVELRTIRDNREQLTNLLHRIDLPIVISDMAGKVRFWNRDAERRYGYAREEILTQSVGRLFPSDASKEVREALWSAIDGRVCSKETTRITKDGRRVEVEMTAIPIEDTDGELAGVATVDRDRSSETKMFHQMQELALYDSLTSLPNRRFFYERLASSLGLAERNGWMVALLFFDLDCFKQVNDSLGHGAGDRLLCEVADRLMSAVRRSDYVGRRSSAVPETTISRLGGDEFTVILSDANDAARTAKRMLDAVSKPIDLDVQEISVSSSVGIAIFPHDGTDAETLIRNADTAMYHAKDLGPGRCAFYSNQMNEQLKRRLDLAARLRHAFEQERLTLAYQPVFRVSTGLPLGAEVLLRWNEEDLGPVSPAEFIPIAEETGLIDRIGTWVLCSSCQWAASWSRAGRRPLSVAVNVSTHQLKLDTLTETVEDALQATHLDPELLTLEITESALIEDGNCAAETMRQIRALGVRVALDDFGTGYSSLSRLRSLRLDGLKIDRAFVSEIGTDAEAAELVAAIIEMAHILKLEVVAEGVETREQLQLLSRNGCDALQGYLLGEPVEGREFERLMHRIGGRPRWTSRPRA